MRSHRLMRAEIKSFFFFIFRFAQFPSHLVSLSIFSLLRVFLPRECGWVMCGVCVRTHSTCSFVVNKMRGIIIIIISDYIYLWHDGTVCCWGCCNPHIRVQIDLCRCFVVVVIVVIIPIFEIESKRMEKRMFENWTGKCAAHPELIFRNNKRIAYTLAYCVCEIMMKSSTIFVHHLMI